MSDGAPHILLASNSGWNLAHFRRPLIDAFIERGMRVSAAIPDGDGRAELERDGVEIFPVPLKRRGTAPLADLRLLQAYLRLFSSLQPDAVLAFTAKPNVYASLAAQRQKIPVINNISGLGTGFLSGGPMEFVMRTLYRAALKHSCTVFFQNPDDESLFVRDGLVAARMSRLLPGSGVDLSEFSAAAMPREERAVSFLLVARMLRDKGVVEFVEAARRLRGEGAKFRLLGPADDDNRSAIAASQLRAWADEGTVEWLGPTSDVRPALRSSDVVVLPSYREGMPRTLIEAAATGRPVIATDVAGCRQAVIADETGLLCAPRSVDSLEQALRRMIALGPDRRAAMGAANRRRAEREFSTGRIVDAYLAALNACGVATGH